MLTLQLSVSDLEIRAEIQKIVVAVLEELLKNPDRPFDGLSVVTPEDLQGNTPHINGENYLTRKELSQLLKVSLVTLHNWQKSGELIPYKIGKRILYKKSDVEGKLLKQNNLNIML